MWRNRILNKNSLLLKWILLALYHSRIIEASFYAKAFLWGLKHRNRKVATLDDLFQYFYIDFLQVPREDITLIKRTETSMTIGCTHDCPILKIAGIMKKDTREVCQRTSKGPCNYFIRKLGNHVRVENDYFDIRPREAKCVETLRIE